MEKWEIMQQTQTEAYPCYDHERQSILFLFTKGGYLIEFNKIECLANLNEGCDG